MKLNWTVVNKSIMICSCIDFGEISAAKNRILRMANSLAISGIRCTIVGFTDKHDKEEDIADNVKLVLLKRVLSNSKFAYSKILKYSFGCSLAYQREMHELMTRVGASLVIAYTYLSPVSSVLLTVSRKKNIPIVFDMVENFKMTPHNLLNGMYFLQKVFMYRDAVRADGLMSISEEWLNWCNKRNIKTVFVPGFLPEKKLTKSIIVQPERMLESSTGIKIVFMGRVNVREQFWKILHSLRLCEKNGIKVDLVVIGERARGIIGVLVDLYCRYFVKNIVKYTGKIDDIYRDSLLDESDLFILLRGDNKETRFSFPTRLPEYLLFNKPMIISPTLDFLSLAKGHKDIYFLPNNSSSNIADSILLISKSKSYVQHNQIIKKLSGKVVGKRLSTFITKLCEN